MKTIDFLLLANIACLIGVIAGQPWLLLPQLIITAWMCFLGGMTTLSKHRGGGER